MDGLTHAFSLPNAVFTMVVFIALVWVMLRHMEHRFVFWAEEVAGRAVARFALEEQGVNFLRNRVSDTERGFEDLRARVERLESRGGR